MVLLHGEPHIWSREASFLLQNGDAQGSPWMPVNIRPIIQGLHHDLQERKRMRLRKSPRTQLRDRVNLRAFSHATCFWNTEYACPVRGKDTAHTNPNL